MKTINLATEAVSDIKFQISKFPDGQQDITILMESGEVTSPILIKSRFSDFKDLELIICATKALRNLGVKEIHLYVPYILGLRSDRLFVEGGTSYLRDIVAPILNNLNYESVTCIDPHSDVAAACINNLKTISNTTLVKFALFNSPNPICKDNDLNNIILVSPDGGALKKIYKVAKDIMFQGEVLNGSKHRDLNGNLSETRIHIPESCFEKEFVIIDDICDGGGTFINLAKVIYSQIPKELQPTTKIHLIVTHGIFSKGFETLYENIETIHCTNSYNELNKTLVEPTIEEFVYQLEIFK
jgi:ribose-phosphate pyrophosphokinase